MVNGEAEELGRFRARIERAELPDLTPIIASLLDDYVDLIRGLGRGRSNTSVEMAAAMSAELHKRNLTTRAAQVGNG